VEPPAVDLDDQRQVGAGPRPPRLDARGEPVNGVAEPLEDGGEEAALLVAVAASPPSDELRAHDVEGNSLVLLENDVDVLERDGLDVGAHQLFQRPRRRRARRLPDPREVRVDVNLRG
jgi:hypothetical protein